MKYSNLLSRLVLMTPLLFAVPAAMAQQLSIFGVELHNATEQSLDAAIQKAGGRVKQKNRGTTVYDAEQIGLPSATTLNTLYFNDRLVMAQYVVRGHGAEDEKLRKMLVAKYGQPQVDKDAFSRASGTFDGQYVDKGKYRWSFAEGMQLIYSKEFGGETYLTYLDRENELALEKLLNSQADKEAKETAKSLTDAF